VARTLRRLSIRNFRSFAEAILDMGSLVVLLGRNGAGKTNLIDALHLLHDAVDSGLDVAITRRGGITAVRRAPGATGRPPDARRTSSSASRWTAT